MSYRTAKLEVENGIAIVTVDRPQQRNALNAELRRELLAIMDHFEDPDMAGDIRVVVFTGSGEKAFIAGADIGEFAERSPLQQRQAMESPRVFERIADFPLPTIAMINGYALGGGCELAMACDLRVAARSARLGQPEVRLGILPGGGGTQRLPRLVGTGAALRLILTGELIEAEEAERLGLVDLVVDDEALEHRTRELATAIAAHSPIALRLCKEAVRASMEMPLSAGLRHERELFITAFSSNDRREGVAAFLEKRPPEFTGT